MPRMRVNGAEFHYEDTGSGDETIVFAHGLIWSTRMFDGQVAALRDRYRCVAFDFRGQGRSEVTRSGYDMDTLARDAAALIEALAIAPVHFAGLSMGGFIGMRLAARRPELLRSLILMETSARPELLRSLILMETSARPEPAANVPKYRAMVRAARILGLRPVAPRVMPVMFGQTFLNDPARAAERVEWQRRAAANRRFGLIRATNGVMYRAGIEGELARIALPTLILCGEEDVATKPEEARHLHERIAGSRLVWIPRAGHTSSVEEPAAVTAGIADFLAGLPRA